MNQWQKIFSTRNYAEASIIQGLLADHMLGIQWSYIVGVACFVYLAFYAIKAKSILKSQGIDYDQKLEVAH